MKLVLQHIRSFLEKWRYLFKKPIVPPITNKRVDIGIINPKFTPTLYLTITPYRYKFTRKEALTVVRPYDYINVPPPRNILQGGGK